ncbi:MAG: NAD(P)H-binding protein [Pseudomonadota bacterium]
MTPKRVLLLGATGTIGRATAKVLTDRGHQVVCPIRSEAPHLDGVETRQCNVTIPDAFRRDCVRNEPFDAIVSCLASRTGAPKDAWAIDYQAHSDILAEAKRAGISQFVLLSAICVQKPKLAFQRAKLAFEAELRASGLDVSIVRPTAYFKSLSGQMDRVKSGKPFMVFGNGALTACKPISDRDLANYLVDCVEDPTLRNRTLPIGGPGPAITPLEQGALLFDSLNLEPRFTRVPVKLLDLVAGGLGALGVVSGQMRAKAELAKIGRYYATESMLVWDPVKGRYDADATPEYGKDTLANHYIRLARGDVAATLGDHAVFS